jgi:hypothetical protein
MTDADRAFWLMITNILVNAFLILVASAATAFGGWLSYKRLQAQIMVNSGKIIEQSVQNAQGITEVRDRVNGHQMAMQTQSERQTTAIAHAVEQIADLKQTIATAVTEKAVADERLNVLAQSREPEAKKEDVPPQLRRDQ